MTGNTPSRRRSILALIGTDPVTRFWMGPGDLKLPEDNPVDPSGVYRGMGVLPDTPAIRQLSGGQAERVEFRFNASHPAVVAMIALGVVGAVIRIACVSFNTRQQIVGVKWLWRGICDAPGIELSEGKWARILSAYSGPATRSMAQLLYWTDPSHQLVHPGDLFFDQVKGMTINRTVRWDAL